MCVCVCVSIAYVCVCAYAMCDLTCASGEASHRATVWATGRRCHTRGRDDARSPSVAKISHDLRACHYTYLTRPPRD